MKKVMESFDNLKIKIFFDNQALVIYFQASLTLERFLAKVKEVCNLHNNQIITIKWIDNEDDPCTISNQCELLEAVNLNKEFNEAELKIHVFLGSPQSPGAPCFGEDKHVYRRGARRWKKKIFINGHRFQPKRFNQRVDCAICSDTIWGLGRAGLKCLECNLCVHKRCHKFIHVDCTKNPLLTQQQHQELIYNNSNAKFFPIIYNNRGYDSRESSLSNSRNGNIGKNDSFKSDQKSNKIEAGTFQSQWSMGIEDFELLTVIGRGSYAKVVQAEHKRTKQIYAIKIIKKVKCTDEDDNDWIQTEKSVFETASNHPFLVGLHSCFQSDSRLFFVIEFIPGGDLMFHMQRQQKLSEDHARFYSAEIILALHFLHSRRIIYRDLKLDNVLIDHDGHIKLTDFGMCKENIGPYDKTSTFCGTPNYIAPEILRGEEYGFSVDFWALGVLMFEMMAGRCPFPIPPNEDQQNTEDLLFEMILERQIRIPRCLSVRAAQILKGFLNKDPLERLGCKPNIEEGFNDIKMFSFFKNSIDWELLEERRVTPPYHPDISGDRDLQRFDTSFTSEEPTLTFDDPSEIARIDQSEFEGFEYINPLIMDKEESV